MKVHHYHRRLRPHRDVPVQLRQRRAPVLVAATPLLLPLLLPPLLLLMAVSSPSVVVVSGWLTTTQTTTTTTAARNRVRNRATAATTTVTFLDRRGDGREESSQESPSSSSSILPEVLRRGGGGGGGGPAARIPPLKPHWRRLYLIRHGQTDWNKEGRMQGGGYDLELNEEGFEQAERLANAMSRLSGTGGRPTVVASSPLKRALQTSLRVGRDEGDNGGGDGGMTRLVDRRLAEMRFGGFEGTVIRGPNASPDDKRLYKSYLERMRRDARVKWPGADGESPSDVSARGLAALRDLLKRYAGDDDDRQQHRCLAVVAHGRFNKILLSTLLHGTCRRFAEIRQDNCCVNILDYDSRTGEWEPVLVNYGGGAAAVRATRQRKVEEEKSRRRAPVVPLPSLSFAAFNGSIGAFGGTNSTSAAVAAAAL